MRFRQLYILPLFLFGLLALTATSCLKDDDDSESEAQWRQDNDDYVARIAASGEYEAYAPAWAPESPIYIKWLNDRSKTQHNLVPLDNSTVDIKYSLSLYDGTFVQDSYSNTAYGDSVYRSKPLNNIVGMWALLTYLHEGDSVLCIMPAATAYGANNNGLIPSYSALLYTVKLMKIQAWEKPNS